MPEENQSPSPSISPTLGKHNRNWKKILLILLILGVSISLVGVGIYFIGTGDFQAPSSQKQATPSAKKQTSNKKGILYLKPSRQSSTLPTAGLLGDLWVYDLASKKEIQITKDGRVANYPIKLSPNGRNIAYRKNIGDIESLWIYDFQTKKEKKLAEFTATVSESEYSRIDDILWKDNSTNLAYLVVNRRINDDPRSHLKTVIKFTYLNGETQIDSKILDIQKGFSARFLVWNGKKIYYKEGGDLGPVTVKSFNTESEKISEKLVDEYLKKIKVLPEISGSPDSQKIAVSGNTTWVFDTRSGEQIFKIESSIIGWTTDGNGVIYKLSEDGKTKLTIYNFKNKQFKFALFPDDFLKNSYALLGFSDFSGVVNANFDPDTDGYKYYVLDIEETNKIELPFTTQSRVTTIPIENF